VADERYFGHNVSMPFPSDDPAHESPPAFPRWRVALGRLGGLLTSGAAFFAIVGFGGSFWWPLELAGHFRIQYFWGLLIGTILLLVGRFYRWAGASAVLVAVHALLLWPFYQPLARADLSTERHPLRIVSLNLLVENSRHGDVLRFIRQASPDIALFLEVDAVWGEVLQDLATEWPYSHTRAQRNNFGLALFSRIPIDDIRIETLGRNYPALIARMDVEGTPLTIVGAHPMSPIGQRRHANRDWQLRRLGRILAETDGEKLLIGDLNCTSWSPAFTDLLERSGLRDTRLGRGVQPTWPTTLPAPMRIPIDHCLISPALEVVDRKVGPYVGSDHLPILVDLRAPERTPKRTEEKSLPHR
jgi:endonuclease/exonuclease/phosphatase (EEP) superfamily protein YafD